MLYDKNRNKVLAIIFIGIFLWMGLYGYWGVFQKMPTELETHIGLRDPSVTCSISSNGKNMKLLMSDYKGGDTLGLTFYFLNTEEPINITISIYDSQGALCARTSQRLKISADVQPVEVYFDDAPAADVNQCVIKTQKGQKTNVCVDENQNSVYTIKRAVPYQGLTEIVLLLMLGGLLGASYIGLTNSNIKKENYFLAAFLGLGLAYLFVLGPLSSPDAATHFELSGNMARAVLGPQAMRTTDLHIENVMIQYYLGPEPGLYSDFWSELLSRPFVQNVGLPETGLLAMGSCNVRYIGDVLARAIGVILHFNGFWTMYLGIIINILFVGWSTFWAIKKTPVLKMAFALISLLPMSLHLTASFHYDGFGIASGLLFFSQLFFLVKNKGTRLDWTRMVAFSAMMGASKNSIILLFALLLIPRERFKDLKEQFAFLTGSCLSGLIGGLLSTPPQNFMALFNGKLPLTPNGYQSGPTRELGEIIEKLMRGVQNTLSVDFLNVFGKQLSAFTVNISAVWIVGFIVLIVFACLEKKDPLLPCLRQKAVLVVACLMFFGTIIWIGYQWGADSTYLIGIQGRYYLPLLIPCAALISRPLIEMTSVQENRLIGCAVLLNVFCLYECVLIAFQ